MANETSVDDTETAPLTGGGEGEAPLEEKAPLTGGAPPEKTAAPADKAPPADAAKLEAEKKAASEAWEKWAPKAPEGVKLDDALIKEFKPLAAELGLKAEGAQKLVDLVVKSQQSAAAAQVAQLDATQKEWIGSLKADKEFGSTDPKKFAANLHIARKATMKYATPELREFLNTTGIEAHPEVVRFFFRVGKALGEDTVAGSGANGTDKSAKSDEALLRRAYPSMFPAES